ncbi:MAG: hypothetical protein EZS28_034365 [Streblomastix strix]|uniref:Uncharacterized protein n=1 Tax=Streblomastix strix TaxID=222440 RepID=A0A5J4UHT3_9EUKA|nr:MAG: hypothetical protein EZS28_034365 [Streblomastix strix]
MCSQRIWMLWNDEITDASTARDILMGKYDIRRQPTFFDMENSTRDSSYGCCPKSWGATLQLRTIEVLVACDLWESKEIKWTSNRKEMEVIS